MGHSVIVLVTRLFLCHDEAPECDDDLLATPLYSLIDKTHHPFFLILSLKDFYTLIIQLNLNINTNLGNLIPSPIHP